MSASRSFTPGERALVPETFARELPLSSVRIVLRAHNPFARTKVLVRGRRIFWPGAPEDVSRQGVGLQTLLVHELAHVWQYETGRLTALRYLTDPRNWQYGYAAGSEFESLGTEAQADLVADWWRVRQGLAPLRHIGAPPTRVWLESVIPFGRPLSLPV